MKKALVVGWFTTAGDLLALDVAMDWLNRAGVLADASCYFEDGTKVEGAVDWRTVDPSAYHSLIFLCGPMLEQRRAGPILERFGHCTVHGLNLSMTEPLQAWNPFDYLVERDSERACRPDIVFAAQPKRVPVVGLCLVGEQSEYGKRQRHQAVEACVRAVLARREMAVVVLDTVLSPIVPNRSGLKTAHEVEALFARMDAVVTTRLHGTVFAIKNGVPPVVLDPIEGGAKVAANARCIGWSTVHLPEQLTEAVLEESLDFCLGAAARDAVQRCAARAVTLVGTLGNLFEEDLRSAARDRTAQAREGTARKAALTSASVT